MTLHRISWPQFLPQPPPTASAVISRGWPRVPVACGLVWHELLWRPGIQEECLITAGHQPHYTLPLIKSFAQPSRGIIYLLLWFVISFLPLYVVMVLKVQIFFMPWDLQSCVVFGSYFINKFNSLNAVWKYSHKYIINICRHPRVTKQEWFC